MLSGVAGVGSGPGVRRGIGERQDPAELRRLTENAVQTAIKAGVELPITAEFALDNAAEARRRLESRATTGKLVIRAAGV